MIGFAVGNVAAGAALGWGHNAACMASPINNLDAAVNGRPDPRATPCDIGAFESAHAPDLKIAKSHTVPYAKRDLSHTDTIRVGHIGTGSANGTVTVTALSSPLPN